MGNHSKNGHLYKLEFRMSRELKLSYIMPWPKGSSPIQRSSAGSLASW